MREQVLKVLAGMFFLLACLQAADNVPVTYTARDHISLHGKANRNVKIELYINDKKVVDTQTNDNGDWVAYNVPLHKDVPNQIYVVAVGPDGNRSKTSTRLTVVQDTSVPQIFAVQVNPENVRSGENLKVTARTDRSVSTVTAIMPDNSLLNMTRSLEDDWTTVWQVPLMIAGGDYRVRLSAANKLGVSTQAQSGVFNVDAQATLVVSEPEDNAVFYTDRIDVKGYARNSSQVELGAERLTLSPDGSFSSYYQLIKPGRNQLTVTATDVSGKKVEEKRSIIKLVTFSDMQNHWARREVEYLATLGYVQAYPNTRVYAPDNNITRAELATLLVRSRQLPTGQSYGAAPVFQDVKNNSWAQGYIETAARYGIVEGYPGRVYKPSNLVTRAEAAMMFTRYANVPVAPVHAPVDIDVSERHWAADSIAALKSSDLLPPPWRDQRRFYPDQPITRAEVAAILARVKDIRDDIDALLGQKTDWPAAAPVAGTSSEQFVEAGSTLLAVASPRDALTGNDLTLTVAAMQRMRQVSAVMPDQKEQPLQYNTAADTWETSWHIPAGFARGQYEIVVKALAESGALFTVRSNEFTITTDRTIVQPPTSQTFPAIQTTVFEQPSPQPAAPPPAAPNQSAGALTRAEAAAILARHGYLKQAIVSAPPAKDVPLNHPQVKVIKSAIVTGIIPNKQPGYFQPDDKVAYAEAVNILRRAKISANIAQQQGFISAEEFERLTMSR